MRHLFLILSLGATMNLAAASPWPQGRKAAVSLTYDDSPPTHLKIAIPALDSLHLKGTFFVNPGQKPFQESKAAWAKAAQNGHEISSHTMTHPCSSSFDWVPKGQGLEDLSLAQITAQIDDTILALNSIGVKTCPSFAYPCGQAYYGKDKTSYVPLLKKRHLYARGVGPDVPNSDLAHLDPYNVPSINGAKSLNELKKLALEAVKSGGWLVIYFHGVGGDHLAVEGKVHEDFLKYLAANPKLYWVAPFGEAAGAVFKGKDAVKAGR